MRPGAAWDAEVAVVGLVLVAHSPELVRGLAAMIAQAAPAVAVGTAGGLSGGRLGTSAPAIAQALRSVLDGNGGDGVLVLLDLGSAAMAIEMAIEELAPGDRSRVLVVDAPLVEGAVLGSVKAAAGLPLEDVADAARRAGSTSKLGPA